MPTLLIKYDRSVYGREPVEQTLGSNWGRIVFETVLMAVLGSVYPNGLHPRDARALSRILSAMDELPSEIDRLDVDEADLEFVRNAVLNDSAKIHPAHSRIFAAMQDALIKP